MASVLNSMDYLQAYPYLTELRELIDSALYRFGELEAAAQAWIRVRTQLVAQASARRDFDRDAFHSALQHSGVEQTHIFDALEAFLAISARISLVLFPSSATDSLTAYRLRRGEDLRTLLDLTFPETIKNRDLRNAWMHFDERLDQAVLTGTLGSRQRFVLSSEAASSIPNTLRLVEVDTLVIHFRDQSGATKSADLRELHRALLDAVSKLQLAWAKFYPKEET